MRLPTPRRLDAIVCDEWNPTYLGIEAATPGLHTIQQLQHTLPIRLLKPQGSKIARATTAATYLEQGKIWFPRKPWRGEWDTELVTFPHNRHDDQVDVLAYAAQQINRRRRRKRISGWRVDPALREPSGAGP